MPANDSNTNEENDLIAEDNSELDGGKTAAETFDRVGTAASEFNDPGAKPVNQYVADELVADEAASDDDSPLRWLIPLLLLGLLIILGYWFCGKSAPVSTTSVINANADKILALAVPANTNRAMAVKT